MFLVNAKKLLEAGFWLARRRSIKNWPAFLADFLGWRRGYYPLQLTRPAGQLRLEAGTYDKWPIVEIILRDCYRLADLPDETGQTIVDLGAHIGVFSVLAGLTHPRAKIYALEPDQRHFNCLLENIKINCLADRVFPYNLACGVKTGDAPFYRLGAQDFGTLMSLGKKEGRVKTISLSAFFRRGKIKGCDFLKMDVEGAEYDILTSLNKGTFGKIKRLGLEYHSLEKEGRRNGRVLKIFLEKQGFCVSQKASSSRIGYLYGEK